MAEGSAIAMVRDVLILFDSFFKRKNGGNEQIVFDMVMRSQIFLRGEDVKQDTVEQIAARPG